MISHTDIDQAIQIEHLLRRNEIFELTLTNHLLSTVMSTLKIEGVEKAEFHMREGYASLQVGENHKFIGREFLLKKFGKVEVTGITSFAGLTALLLTTSFPTEDLVDRLSMELSKRHNNLSLGQAIAMVKRTLTIQLNSQERTQLSRLRKKVKDSINLVKGFGQLVGVDSIDLEPRLPHYQVYFYCRKCETTVEYTGELIDQPTHCSTRMQMVWTERKEEKYTPQDSLDELKSRLSQQSMGLVKGPGIMEREESEAKIFLVCETCGEKERIGPSLQKLLLKSDDRINLPEHHGKEMKLVIEEDDPSVHRSEYLPFIEKLAPLVEEILERDEDPNNYLLYTCEECGLLEMVKRKKPAPEHHGKEMRYIPAGFPTK